MKKGKFHIYASVLIFPVAACSGPGTIIRDRPVEVRVPVAQPCAGSRPARIIPLKDQLSAEEWAARDVRQKAATIGKQALDRQTYGEQLDAATAACPLASSAASSAGGE